MVMPFARQVPVLDCRLPGVPLRAVNSYGAYARRSLTINNKPNSLSQLPQTASHEEIINKLRHNGAVIVKSLVSYPSVQKSLDDVSPFFRPAAEPYRKGDFFQGIFILCLVICHWIE